MKTTETTSEQQADEEAVIEHVLMGKPLDPQVRRRVQARAEKITEEVRRVHGNVDIDELVRDARDES